MDRREKIEKQPHPREEANILSLISFFYNLKVFIKGFRKPLEVEDLYEVPKKCESEELGDMLEKQWLIDKNTHKKASICRATLACFWRNYMMAGLLQFVVKTVVTIWLPVSLSKLISYFSPGQKELTKNDAIYYAAVVIGINIFSLFYNHNYSFYLIELGIRVRTAICSLLYRKALKLSTQSLSATTIGKIVTVITKDIDSFEMFIFFAHTIWISLIQTAIVCYLMYSRIGASSFSGIGVFLVMFPVQAILGKITYSLRLRSSQESDRRLEVMQETLSAIKVIKMYNWEKYFIDKINWARKKEVSKLKKISFTTVSALTMGSLCAKVAFFVFVMTYARLGNDITAELAYFIMTCFESLENSLGVMIPYGIFYVAQISAGTKRIESILEAEELPPSEESEEKISNPEIVLKGVTTKIGQVKIFDDVSITIRQGLNVVVGHVGAGKTTFLKVILNECRVTGHLEVRGKISYASQEPWLFPASIRNNILFGEDYCEKRYQKVLDVCALNYDLESFCDGDGTIVGDHGVNLSKGQQARINLARAIYRDSDIYLLDDCLTALDAYVSDYIFKECIQSYLAAKICIFTTNNFSYMQKADKVILINRGSIKYSDKPLLGKYLKDELKRGEKLELTRKKKLLEEMQLKEVYKESKKSGKVSIGIYRKYFEYGGSLLEFSAIFGLLVIINAALGYSDKLVSKWVTLEQNLTSSDDKTTTEYRETFEERTSVLNIYMVTVIGFSVLTFVQAFAYFNFARRASINLHKAMVQNVVNATMAFFDSYFIGSILNRFSKDLTAVDEFLPFFIADCLKMMLVIPSCVILLASVNLSFLLQFLLLAVVAYFIRSFCQRTGRNLQRLDFLTRSPMVGHLNSTLEGLTTIRASKAQKIIKQEYDRHQNLFTSANYSAVCSTESLSFALDALCLVFALGIIVRFLVEDLDTSVGDVGLAITQSFIVSDAISNGIKSIAYCENTMTSVERIFEYIGFKTEDRCGRTLEDWPKKGLIRFDDVSLAYENQSGDMLNNISFVIEPGQKMGIVGRTGAGKSSIISSLFRLYPIRGKIFIDDVDIQTLSLDFLRSKITVIPQDPILFRGTIRDNIDPLKKHQDGEIWKVIEELQLKTLIKNLDTKIDKASTLSAGQKQLVCLVRAILRNSKIVVLDEATANVDQETDSLMHEVVRKNFAECTVIIVAHRLLSVLNCHKVAVLDRGKVTELDEPTKLLENKNSFLHSVVQ